MPTLEEEISRRRTFAIISHPDAGKTTLTEKFLLYGGAIAQAGEVKGKRAKAATSDWMEIEKQRGISVTSSVMQFQHDGFCINILDTPGHQDFSEDTYRTLMAADSAVMVIDGAKGVEPQTRKLFKVCALRHIPIFTFINKMDRETRDPLELCEEVERELGIDTYAVNWPIGCGKEFAGVYDREKQRILFFSGETRGKKVNSVEAALDDPAIDEMLGAEKAAKLRDEVELLGAGEVVDGVMDVIAKDSNPVTVKLEPEKVNGLLGTDVSREEMVRILESLDFTVEGDTIHVPSWRSDVEHYSDIAEEVARFFGYNNIPDTLSNGLTARRGLTDIQQTENLLGSVCRAAGYDEIITYSFISPTYYDKIDLPKDSALRDSLKILNPLGEDTSIMRTTTLPSMLEILTRNYNFRNKSAKLYELGRVYFKRADGLADEPKVLTLGAYGDNMDFFTLKGAVEAVLKQLRIENVRFAADRENPSYHPGRCAKVYCGDRLLGTLGQIHPHVADNYGVGTELYAAELWFDALYESKGAQPMYQPLPKFPAVTRDIAVVCGKDVTVGQLEDAIRKGAKGLLKDVALFDIYTGAGIAPGKKSVAFNLTLRSDDRSLTAEEADADVKSILTALEQECGAVLR